MSPFVLKWKGDAGLTVETLGNALWQLGDELPDPLAGRLDVKVYAEKLWLKADVAFAYDRSELLGVMAMYANDDKDRKAFISVISVSSHCQSKGVGSAFVSAAKALAESRGMKTVWLKVHPQNERAEKFYLKHGFSINGSLDGKTVMEFRIA